MKIQTLINKLSLEILTDNLLNEIDFTDVYTSDLLSAALAKLTEKHIWITIQVHQNILGVASIKEVPAVLLGENMTPDAEVISKAKEKKILLLKSSYNSYELSALIYNLLKEEKSGS